MEITRLKWAEAQELVKNNKDSDLLFLEFTTDWCGDCKMMKPVVTKLASWFSEEDNIKFVNVDAEEAQLFRNPDSRWQVLKVPTHILLKGQEIVEKAYEYVPGEVLKTWIEQRISK